MHCEQCDFVGMRHEVQEHWRVEHSNIAELIKTHDIKPTELSRCNVCGKMAPTIELFEHFLVLHCTPVLQLVAKP